MHRFTFKGEKKKDIWLNGCLALRVHGLQLRRACTAEVVAGIHSDVQMSHKRIPRRNDSEFEINIGRIRLCARHGVKRRVHEHTNTRSEQKKKCDYVCIK